MHVVWYTAASMDGRIAGAHDNLDFLSYIDMGAGTQSEFADFMSTVDAILIGGNTVRWLLGQGESLPATNTPIWLLTHDTELWRRLAETDPENTPVHHGQGSVADVLDEIEAAGHQRLWICGGGVVAGQVLALDRIDEVILTVAGTALGAGPTIFEAEGLPLRRFALEECRQYGNAARLRWVRDRSAAG